MGALWVSPGKQTFVDGNGKPLVAGLVWHYVPGTDDLKDTWIDEDQGALNTNPVVLDMRGQASIWGTGLYRQRLTDALGNEIWDKVTGVGATATDSFDTLALAEAAIIGVNINWVFIAGYWTPGDGGGATYGRMAIGAPGAGRFQSADGAYWQLGEAAPNLLMFGAKGDGATDDTLPIKAAASFCAAHGLLLTGAPRTYRITSKIVISCACVLDDCTFSALGIVGVAVELSAGGAADPGVNASFGPCGLPQMENASKTVAGWAQPGVVGTVGVRIVGLLSMQIRVPRIEGFEVGLRLTAFGVGCYWNTIFLGRIHNCKIGEQLIDGAGGNVNSNRFLGGDIRFDSGEGTDTAGTRCIQIESADSNDNLFVGCSVEGNTPEYHIEDNGIYNQYVQLRYEAASCKVHLGNAASRAQFTGGYKLEDIVISGAGAGAAMVVGGWRQAFSVAAGPAGGAAGANLSSNAYPVFAAYDSNVNPMTQAVTSNGWVTALGGLGVWAKQHGDANPRIQMGIDGALRIGDGIEAINLAPRFYSDGTNNVLFDGGDFELAGSSWAGVRFRLGAYFFWVDAEGRLRIKAGAPAGDHDGTIVGTQA